MPRAAQAARGKLRFRRPGIPKVVAASNLGAVSAVQAAERRLTWAPPGGGGPGEAGFAEVAGIPRARESVYPQLRAAGLDGGIILPRLELPPDWR